MPYTIPPNDRPSLDAPIQEKARWLVNQMYSDEPGIVIDDDFLRDFGAEVINSMSSSHPIDPIKVMALIQYTRLLEDNKDND